MVKINNFWILSTSGIPLFLLSDKSTEENLLIGGFFSALQILIDNIEQSPFNKLELENKTYFYYYREPIIAVVEAATKTEIESQVCHIVTEKLGKKFVEMFQIKSNENLMVDLSHYSEFRLTYEKMTFELDEMLAQSHKDFLTKYFVDASKDEDILGLVIYDLEKDEILLRDTPPDCSIEDFESFGSMLFAFLGRLGKNLQTGQINEILIRGQKYWLGGFRKGSLAVFTMFDLNYFGKVIPDFVKSPLDGYDK